jgi:hypothetical protein
MGQLLCEFKFTAAKWRRSAAISHQSSELGVVRILVGPDQRFDLQVEQGVECGATKPEDKKKYSFHFNPLHLVGCASWAEPKFPAGGPGIGTAGRELFFLRSPPFSIFFQT